MSVRIDEQTEINPRPRNRKTRVEIPADGLDAKVIETIDGKRVQYDAVVKEDEVTESETNGQTENETFAFESKDFDFASESEVKTIPKTALEKMFQDLRYAIATGFEDGFYAQVVRLPDSIGARFNIPCGTQMDLGVFQFRSTDQFQFRSAIQGINGNSGGLFNVRVYALDQTPLTLTRRLLGNLQNTEVGLFNYSVPNPIAPTETPSGQPSSNIENALLQYMEKTERRFESLLQEMRQQREPSVFEKALQQKMMQDILNPPAPKGFDVNEFTQQIMTQGAVMAGLGDAFNKMIFREPPVTPEPSTLETIVNMVNTPAGMTILENLNTVSEVVKQRYLPVKTNGAAPAPDDTEYYDEPNDMQELITDLVTELESENELNHENEFIQKLTNQYPTQASMIKMACKGAAKFDEVLLMLLDITKTMEPSPFFQFLDIAETQKTQAYVWNERGQKMLVRLNQFYEFVKSQP